MAGSGEPQSAVYAPLIPMPLRNERRAPKFDGHGAYLSQFFRDFETVAYAAGLPDDEWITKVIDYVPVEEYELWRSVGRQPKTHWAKFKTDIAKFYAGADHERKYTVSDLERVSETFASKTSVSRADFSDFYRKFYTIATYLKDKERLSSREAARLLLNALHLDLRNQVRAQLRAMHPSHHPDDPFPVTDIVDAVNIVLATSSADSFYAAPARTYQALPPPQETHLPIPRTTHDASNLLGPDPVDRLANRLETAFTSMLTRVTTVGSFANMANNGGQPQRNGPMYRGCVWCRDERHWSSQCPRRADLVSKGMIVQSSIPGRYSLPDGSDIIRRSGMSLGDAVEDWHRQRQNQPLPSRTTPATGANAVPIVQSNIFQVAEVNTVHQRAYIEDVPEDEPTPSLPMATSALLEEVDGEENECAGTVDPDHLPLLEATHAALTMKIEAARRATRSSTKKQEEDPQKTKATNTPQPTSRVTITPQAPKLKEAPITGAVAQPTIPKYTHPNAAAPPQFRFVTPIEDPGRTASLVERSLDSPISLSMRELLSVAPDLRKGVRELISTKRIPTGTDAKQSLLSSIGDDADTATANLVSVLLNALPANASKTVANDAETLRTIEVELDGRVKVDAILDDGSQIIGIRRDIWERLGLPLRSDHRMTMEAANASTSQTLGLLPNLKVYIGTCEFILQVQVVEEAGYDMLLGRPFHVLAQAQVQHFRNGGAVATLTDPHTRAVITVPTKARGSATTRVAVDFCES
ncbi:hypothetical protein DFP72DRAFT_881994 [Ephemerocybe angulata]|uniref:CCHC-type domain-containing protein n=1 Tax=Ephemerocybe angulata TaxID=980116 RepID=A0A8H6IAV6_9AGAR|nr:hypothetical protein DFP72DRAFT_881994 [Tulosesus angulatus]